MRRLAIAIIVLLLLAMPVLAAESQEDEPSPFEKRFGDIEEIGIDVGVYLSAGKALRAYDFGRLNSKLAAGGTDPFNERIDDWNFELAFVSTRDFFFAFAGGFWEQETGGAAVDASLEGYEILARWGTAIVDNRLVQIFPVMGIGYAKQTLTVDGQLATLGWDNLPRRGEEEIVQSGMVLEAGLRVDMYSGMPKRSSGALLTVESLTLGWQGQPIVSDWENGSKTIEELPDAFNSAFFVRLNLGLGLGLRMTSEE